MFFGIKRKENNKDRLYMLMRSHFIFISTWFLFIFYMILCAYRFNQLFGSASPTSRSPAYGSSDVGDRDAPMHRHFRCYNRMLTS